MDDSKEYGVLGEKSKTSSEIVDRKKQDIATVDEDGKPQIVSVDMDKIKLTDAGGQEKVIIKPHGEKVEKPEVKQSDLIFVVDKNKEHLEITGTPVEVDETAEKFIAEALDYFFTCKVRHVRLAALDPENPERCPYANSITFRDFLSACIEYSTDQLHKDVPVIRARPELQYYISTGDLQGYNEQVSLLKQIMEDTVVAYESFLALDTITQKGIVDSALGVWEERKGRELKMQELTEKIKNGEDISELVESLNL